MIRHCLLHISSCVLLQARTVAEPIIALMTPYVLLLQARTVAEPIIAAVALMADSGLPCFSRGAPVENLRKRFHLEMSERQAAAFMRQTIADAYQKWTTGVYDALQNIQNRIPF